VIQPIQHFVEHHPVWNWTLMVGTAIAAWIAPVAGFVTIGCALLHGYIAWQKYKQWRKDNAS
jgi:hypothetical protein